MMGDQSVPLHVAWRRAYDADRFCRHLTQAQLNQRIRDIFLNMLVLTPDGKIGLGSPQSEETLRWMLRWTQVLEEMQLRHGPYPNGFSRDILHREPLPDFVGELARKAAAVCASRRMDPSNMLIKYGKREHMAALFAHGRARIQPASFFAAMDHNGAVRDDERNLGLSVVLSRDDVVSLVVNPQDVAADAGDQVVEVNYQSPNDFWLYCVATSLEPRLFVDFNADACVIIKDRAAFAGRLQRAASPELLAAQLQFGEAMYVDPLRPETAKIYVPFAKHFRYGYQREFRFVWLPAQAASEPLSHVDVELGPLGDIAELVEL